MAQFDDDRRRLGAARNASETARRALVRINDQIAQAQTGLDELGRRARAGGERGAAERRALEERKRRLEASRDEHRRTLGGLHEELAGASDVFWKNWTDPRINAARLRDEVPVLLFPLRLETRFKTVARREGTVRQLWVRVYPDECLIDSFDGTLSHTELDSADVFWREYFHAAGNEDAERAAWRGLVASHGSGRASWIVRQYRPLNPLAPGDPLGNPALDVKPSTIAAGEVLLVVSLGDGSATSSDRSALGVYWAAFWKAHGSAALQTAALTALSAAVGGAAHAEQLVEDFSPYNLAEAPPSGFTHATATPRVVFVVLPARDDIDAKTRSWTQAARATVLPERFVLLGYRGGNLVVNEIGAPVDAPLAVSPDPSGSPDEQFEFDEHGNLIVGDELRWMTEFDEAVRRGMGFKVDLSSDLAGGFDRLFVLGLRLSADAPTGKSELEALFTNQYFSRAGFSLLPQGAATNNTEEVNSAYSREDDADSSYDFVFANKAQFAETEEWLEKRDGQWFAEALGLDTGWLKQVPHAGGVDQAEVRAMNAALWPATLGYFMDTLLQPVFDDDQIYHTRWFFNRYVSGRGPIPAIRIGRQPYGVLLTTAYSRMRWTSDREGRTRTDLLLRFREQRGRAFHEWLSDFTRVIDRLRAIWTGLARGVPHVDAHDRDPHQTLLDIVGLHASSVEFHQRYANTKDQEHNIANLWHLVIPWATLPANELHNQAFDLLVSLGYSGLVPPQLFDLFWKVTANRLNGPVIQEGPLSETEALRAITTNNRNYIEWLYEWARVSFDAIRLQDGFQNNARPNALLYILLKHALELGYHDAGIRVLDEAQLLDADAKLALRAEPHFFHIQEAVAGKAVAAAAAPAAGRSKYEMLYSPNERVTGSPSTLLVDHITRGIGALFPARYLTEQLRALSILRQTPTARLERLLAEHLDCCTYRLDAWMTGLVGLQLASMRDRRGNAEAAGGIYLGAYGWLENVRPAATQLQPVLLRGALDEVFNAQQPAARRTPLLGDPANEGYIHAPSVNHAVTAAILRNGYIANATPAQPEVLKVNLSSERVRIALGFIEGIRNGQSLAALLGYQFERGLHDRHTFAESDQFIYPLRLVFPLYTRTEDLPEGASIQSIEARNVVNGLNLVRHVKNAAAVDKTYPFGFPPSRLPAATPAQRTVIDAEVDRLLDIHDALADLAMAEGVHQVVMGNYDRAAATLDAYSQATFPPTPDVVQTPRSGIALTHRVGLHFEANVAAAAGDNPRVRAEPAMNRWVAGILPAPARIGCTVAYLDASGIQQTTIVTAENLGLQPLDLVYMLRPDSLEARSELEDRVRDLVLRDAALNVRPDRLQAISYATGDTGDYSFVEIAPFVRSLRALLLRSRPLRATDVALPTEAASDTAPASALDRTRVDFLPAALTAERTTGLVPLQAQLDAVFPEAGPDTAAIVAGIDGFLDDIIAVCRELALYGIRQTGFGIFHERRAAIFTMLFQKAAEIAVRWQDRMDQYDVLMLTLPSLVDEGERIALLLRAERLISTEQTDAEGMTSAQVETIVDAKNTAFRSRQAAFADLSDTTETTLAGLIADFEALLPVSDFDVQEVELDDVDTQVVTLAEDVATRTTQLIEEVDRRIVAVQEKLAAHDLAADPDARVQLLTDAGRIVFGDELVLVPSFVLSGPQADEWANAYGDRERLLRHQTITLANPFPVDDWLYGVARVREKLHHVENLTFLAEALQTTAPGLRAVQFPYDHDAHWMALEYPPESKPALERELLLYTAHYAQDFDETLPQCGLLLDEWTEVIPGETETTGLTFHFDKPNAEPPQALLLVTPPQFTGAWKWDDLVATLHDTLDMARLRAVEPQQLDQTALSVFLPATILATTWHPVTIAADLANVNNYVSRVP